MLRHPDRSEQPARTSTLRRQAKKGHPRTARMLRQTSNPRSATDDPDASAEGQSDPRIRRIHPSSTLARLYASRDRACSGLGGCPRREHEGHHLVLAPLDQLFGFGRTCWKRDTESALARAPRYRHPRLRLEDPGKWHPAAASATAGHAHLKAPGQTGHAHPRASRHRLPKGLPQLPTGFRPG